MGDERRVADGELAVVENHFSVEYSVLPYPDFEALNNWHY